MTVDFEKSPNNPLLDCDDGNEQPWDTWQMLAPKVIGSGSDGADTAHDVFVSDRTMWYSGGAGSGPSDNDYQIGRATSSDNGQSWTRDTANNPVFSPSGSTNWDAGSVLESHVILDGSQYRMYYAGQQSGIGNPVQIGLATSDDGIAWNREASNPVIPNGGSGQPDEQQCSKPCVLKLSDIDYRCWYSGLPAGGGANFVVMYATSPDGISWFKLGQVHAVSGQYVIYPYVIVENNVFLMYVQEGPNGGPFDVNRYWSTNGFEWTFDRPVIARSQIPAWDDFYLGGAHSI